MSDEVAQLKAKVRELEEKLKSLDDGHDVKRVKITEMSSEVVDSNPYSRYFMTILV